MQRAGKGKKGTRGQRHHSLGDRTPKKKKAPTTGIIKREKQEKGALPFFGGGGESGKE